VRIENVKSCYYKKNENKKECQVLLRCPQPVTEAKIHSYGRRVNAVKGRVGKVGN